MWILHWKLKYNRRKSVKQLAEYFYFRCEIQLDPPINVLSRTPCSVTITHRDRWRACAAAARRRRPRPPRRRSSSRPSWPPRRPTGGTTSSSSASAVLRPRCTPYCTCGEIALRLDNVDHNQQEPIQSGTQVAIR